MWDMNIFEALLGHDRFPFMCTYTWVPLDCASQNLKKYKNFFSGKISKVHVQLGNTGWTHVYM